jgi:hypothetical protein
VGEILGESPERKGRTMDKGMDKDNVEGLTLKLTAEETELLAAAHVYAKWVREGRPPGECDLAACGLLGLARLVTHPLTATPDDAEPALAHVPDSEMR